MKNINLNKSKDFHLFCISLLFLLLLLAGCLPHETTREDWNGAWIGTIETEPFPELMTLNIDSNAIIKLFYENVDYVPAAHFSVMGDSMLLKIDEIVFTGLFRGKMVGTDSIVGQMEIGGKQYRTGFVRTAPMGLGEATEFNGFYRLAPGHVVEISPYVLDFTLNPLTILDYKTGVKRLAFPRGKGGFVAGKRMLAPYPPDFSFEFVRKDSSILFRYGGKNSDGELGERLADLTKQKEIQVENGDATLRGTMTFPATEGPHPLVVFVAGRGRQFRGSMIDDFVKLLPYYGIATLLYDKRGCGSSTGSLLGSNYENFANDLEAIVEHVATIDQIQSDKIGLLGIDEAGLIMPMVASRNPLVQFMVNLSGTVFSKEEQEYQACASRMRADSFGEAAVESALAYQQKMFAYVKGQLDSVSLQRASEKAAEQPWSGYVTLFSQKGYIEWWRQNHNVSPRPYLKQLTIPQLVMYGEKDLLIPTEEAVPIMQQILEENGHPLNQLEVFPDANHLLMQGEKRGDFQFSEIEGYPEGLFEHIHEWVGDAVGLK